MKLFKLTIFSVLVAILSSCTHTIDFRSSHFATPTVSDKQWGGSFALSGATPSKVTVINNISSNPPVVNPIKVNEDIDIEDILSVNKLGVDLNLSIYPSLEAFVTGSVFGLKWQFLNHAKHEKGTWVGSVLLGASNRTVDDSVDSFGAPSDEAKSKVKTLRYGASLGYKTGTVFTPYVSYIHEDHEVKTDVKNSFGHFGPYESEGKHDYATLGVQVKASVVTMALEYNFIFLDWKEAEYKRQNTLGILLGLNW